MTSINQLKWSENIFPQLAFPLCDIFTCSQPETMNVVLFILLLVLKRGQHLKLLMLTKDAVSRERPLTHWSKVATEGMERENAHRKKTKERSEIYCYASVSCHITRNWTQVMVNTI